MCTNHGSLVDNQPIVQPDGYGLASVATGHPPVPGGLGNGVLDYFGLVSLLGASRFRSLPTPDGWVIIILSILFTNG